MERTIAVAALRSFVELAKIDHLVFKFEIYQVFMGLQDKRADDVASQTTCRLGHWYYEGEGKTRFSHLDGYRSAGSPARRGPPPRQRPSPLTRPAILRRD